MQIKMRLHIMMVCHLFLNNNDDDDDDNNNNNKNRPHRPSP
jgi:hypothetical protein